MVILVDELTKERKGGIPQPLMCECSILRLSLVVYFGFEGYCTCNPIVSYLSNS